MTEYAAPDYSGLAYSLGGRPRTTPYERRRGYGYGLLQQSMNEQPIDHPAQGIARLAQALMGGFAIRNADQQEEGDRKKRADELGTIMQEPDPQKRLAMMAKLDPDSYGRFGAQWTIEQGKLQEAARRAREAGDTFDTAWGGGNRGPMPQMQAGPPGTPEGFNNNSGNIRASDAAWNGKGTPYNGFETFLTPLHGANAHFGNLQAYAQKNPNMTVAQAIATWAPRGDGNNDPNAYTNTVTRLTGIPGDAPLAAVLRDPQAAARLMQGMTVVEKGGLPQGFTPDTFLQAANGQRPPAPQAAPQGIPQGDQNAPGVPPPPSPNVIAQAPPQAGPPQVPDVPRPQLDPQTRARLRMMVQSGAMTPAQAEAEAAAEVNRQWQVRREQEKTGYDQKLRAYELEQKGRQELEQKAPQSFIAHRTKNYEENIRPKAESAVAEISAIHQARQLLDSGAFTGYGADAQAYLARAGQALGLTFGADAQANTAALQSAMGQRVLALVKNLGSGTSITDSDRNYAERIAGGDVTVGEPAMRKILAIGERTARNVLKNHAGEVERLRKLPGMGQVSGEYFGLPDAPDYETWAKANPLSTPAAQPAKGPAIGAVEGGYRFKGGNPADRNSWEKVR